MADGSWKYIKDIKVGDKVLSWNGREYEEDIVTDHFCTGEKEVFDINMQSFKNISATSDHEFVTKQYSSKKEADNYLWKKLSDIPMNKERNSKIVEIIKEFIEYIDGLIPPEIKEKYLNKS